MMYQKQNPRVRGLKMISYPQSQIEVDRYNIKKDHSHQVQGTQCCFFSLFFF